MPNPWEAAYLAFETPEAEIAKFMRRLQSLGADAWSRDAHIVELFCGRGNGLRALHRLNFRHLKGVDLSLALLAEHQGPGELECCDCRQLTLADASTDIAIVQGGLHHLPSLPEDLVQTLREVKRILRPDGRFVVVEPWLTPFLRAVHVISRNPEARRLSRRLDALQTMIEHEIVTYEQWLGQPDAILTLLHSHFSPEICRKQWGKLFFVGRPR